MGICIAYVDFRSEEGTMKAKRYITEQIAAKLREAEVLQGKGMTFGEVCHQLVITDVTYYRRQEQYGGLRVD